MSDNADPIVSLADQKYADPAVASEEYEAYKADKIAASMRAVEREKAIALALAPSTRSMIEDIAFRMAEQGAKA